MQKLIKFQWFKNTKFAKLKIVRKELSENYLWAFSKIGIKKIKSDKRFEK